MEKDVRITENVRRSIENGWPGSGVLCVPLRSGNRIGGDELAKAFYESTPVGNSFGRLSPLLTRRCRKYLRTILERHARGYAETFARIYGREPRLPVLDDPFLEEWNGRFRYGSHGILPQLGVAEKGDTVALCESAKGGLFFIVETWGSRRGVCWEDFGKLAGCAVWNADEHFRYLIDFSILECLSKVNRLLLYNQVARHLGWFKVYSEREMMDNFLIRIDGKTGWPTCGGFQAKAGDYFTVPRRRWEWSIVKPTKDCLMQAYDSDGGGRCLYSIPSHAAVNELKTVADFRVGDDKK